MVVDNFVAIFFDIFELNSNIVNSIYRGTEKMNTNKAKKRGSIFATQKSSGGFFFWRY